MAKPPIPEPSAGALINIAHQICAATNETLKENAASWKELDPAAQSAFVAAAHWHWNIHHEVKMENSCLRALAAKHGCVYGHQKDGVCSLGYPGCACADDLMCWGEERMPTYGAEKLALVSQLEQAKSLLSLILDELPVNRDWLNPTWEQAAREMATSPSE